MIKSYLKTSVRFLLKNKTFSFINIIGLAFGTVCCLYILLYMQDQYSYDKHHKDAKDIYRLVTSTSVMGDNHNMATASPPIAPAMKADFPEVEEYARFYASDLFVNSNNLLKYKDKSFNESSLAYVDSTFFDVLCYHFVYGKNTKDILAEPFSAVLSKSTAIKLFGNENPVDKIITIDNNFGKQNFKVKAVVDESLGKTHLSANIFVAMNSGGFGRFLTTDRQWARDNMMCAYIKLRPGTDPAALEKKLPAFLEKHGAQQLKAAGMIKALHLQSISAAHTTTGYEFEAGKPISAELLYILAGIAIMIQLIACINFMNLSTARASKRAKEVGVRKVVGAERKDLVKQFLGESFLLTLIGVSLAIPLLSFALPFLNGITQANIQFSFLNHFNTWMILTAIVAVTGFIAGSYPAFYLSAFEAIKVLKGNFTSHVSASGIRCSLVVFQFFLSIVLITAIIIIYSQLNFIKNKDLGFDKSQKLIFSFYTNDARQKMNALATDLEQLSGVKYASLGDNYLSRNVGGGFPFYLEGGNESASVNALNMAADEKFVRANGIKIVAGRNFMLKDTSRMLVNETLCKRLGLKVQDAPGARLYSKNPDGSAQYFKIAGVMKDFNYDSLHGEIGPFMIFYNGNPGNYFSFMTISVNSNNYRSLLSRMEAVWQKNLPGVPFQYIFLDQAVQKQYESEISMSNIINAFTIMAVAISCLGLFGLAAFSAEQRKKEIGIRKVLGASITSVVTALSKEFIWLVGIAFVLATPAAWWAMHQWLQAFAYKVPVSWWMFAAAGALSIIIALLTVSFQAIRAALANPVRSLRSE
ncbi:MAG: ABC transporter permease [Bacteroidota bacterium]